MTKQQPIRARDLMDRRIEALSPDAGLHDAVQTLLRRGYPGAPVVNARGQLLGAFSEHDSIQVLCDAVYEGWPEGTVADHMTRNVETLAPDDELVVVARRFAQSRHRVLPVVLDGKPIGMVARAEVMRALDRLLERDRPKGVMQLLWEGELST